MKRLKTLSAIGIGVRMSMNDQGLNPIVEIPRYMRDMDLKKLGNFYVSRCPIHNGDELAFTVDMKKKKYYCFNCGAKGTADELLNILTLDKSKKAIKKTIGIL